MKVARTVWTYQKIYVNDNINLDKDDQNSKTIDVIDISSSEFVEPLLGNYYITVRLKSGFDYNNYTAKIKSSNEALVYDESVGAFYYTNSANPPESVTVIITEKATSSTQEITLNKTK